MKLTKKHLRLRKLILDRGLSDGCSDLSYEESSVFTKEEWKQFAKEFHDWNGDPETFQERTNFELPDWAVIKFIDHELVRYYEEKNE